MGFPPHIYFFDQADRQSNNQKQDNRNAREDGPHDWLKDHGKDAVVNSHRHRKHVVADADNHSSDDLGNRDHIFCAERPRCATRVSRVGSTGWFDFHFDSMVHQSTLLTTFIL
jgi:hypothetical protein